MQENRPLVLAYIAKFFACGAPELNPDDDEVCAHVSCILCAVCVFVCVCVCVLVVVVDTFV
jgi:hypothetical protein